MDVSTAKINRKIKLPKDTRTIYGKAIAELQPEDGSIMLQDDDDQSRVLKFIKREYGDERTYITRRVNKNIYIFRTK